MKKVYLLLTVALLSSALVSAQLSRITKNEVKKNTTQNTTVARHSTPSHSQTQTPAALIWSDDFSNPANWTISHAPGTTGNWLIGPLGPQGQVPITTIATTGDFAIFDSDSICSGDQIGDLTTANSIDLTGHPNVRLSWNEFYKRFHDSTYVYVSTNGTSWTRFEAHAGMTVNFYSGASQVNTEGPNPYLASLDISSVAGNQATVWIRFEFYSPDTNGAGPDTMTVQGVPGVNVAGCGYAWMIDDVTITDIAATDARMMPADIGEYHFPDHST